MKNVINYIPNLLTVFRIILIPFFIRLVFLEKYFYAFVLFGFLSLTDFLDGYLARRWNVVSNFGKIADPLADKILMISSYFMFAYLSCIPKYVSVIVILRDILILFVVALCRYKKITLKIDPIMSSKINTTIQLIYILLILSCKCLIINITSILLDICSVVVCVSTVFSFSEYAKKYFWIKDAVCK